MTSEMQSMKKILRILLVLLVNPVFSSSAMAIPNHESIVIPLAVHKAPATSAFAHHLFLRSHPRNGELGEVLHEDDFFCSRHIPSLPNNSK